MITVKNETTKKINNFWNGIVFHPTDAIEDDWGQKLLENFSSDNAVETVRIYAMLEDIVKLNEDNTVSYDFALNDQRIEYLLSLGFTPMINYGFIPPFMCVSPLNTSSVSKNKTRYKGKYLTNSYPADYSAWGEICKKYTEHIVEVFGIENVSKWYLQCYNEPDISIFFMDEAGDNDSGEPLRIREYVKMYSAFASAVKTVSPSLKIGTSLAFRKGFLDETLKAITENGLPIDFVGLHEYGTNVQDLNSNADHFSELSITRKHKSYLSIIEKYLDTSKVDIVVDEWGAASTGFLNIEECPRFIFRENTGYASYFGKMIYEFIKQELPVSKLMICLSGQHEMVTDFSGFRNFFTLNFIKKPIYNAFILCRNLGNQLLEGDCDNKNAIVIPTKNENGKLTLVVSYASEDYETPLEKLNDSIVFDGFSGKHKITQYVIDNTHTNPYGLSRKFGTENFTDEQIEILKNEGELKPVISEIDFDKTNSFDFQLDYNGLMLLEIE